MEEGIEVGGKVCQQAWLNEQQLRTCVCVCGWRGGLCRGVLGAGGEWTWGANVFTAERMLAEDLCACVGEGRWGRTPWACVSMAKCMAG